MNTSPITRRRSVTDEPLQFIVYCMLFFVGALFGMVIMGLYMIEKHSSSQRADRGIEAAAPQSDAERALEMLNETAVPIRQGGRGK